MTALTGTVELTRFILRRDRIRILVWILAIVALAALTATGIKGLFPTQAALDQTAAATQHNAAAIAFNGPAQGLNTVGGQVAFQFGAAGMVMVALMSLFMVGRLTRGEEEAGRLELMRSLPVGSLAPTLAASLTVAAMNIAVGVLTTVALLAEGLPAAGSLVFGVSFILIGLVFGGVALVAAKSPRTPASCTAPRGWCSVQPSCCAPWATSATEPSRGSLRLDWPRRRGHSQVSDGGPSCSCSRRP